LFLLGVGFFQDNSDILWRSHAVVAVTGVSGGGNPAMKPAKTDNLERICIVFDIPCQHDQEKK